MRRAMRCPERAATSIYAAAATPGTSPSATGATRRSASNLSELGGGLRPPSETSPQGIDCAGIAGARNAVTPRKALCPWPSSSTSSQLQSWRPNGDRSDPLLAPAARLHHVLRTHEAVELLGGDVAQGEGRVAEARPRLVRPLRDRRRPVVPDMRRQRRHH